MEVWAYAPMNIREVQNGKLKREGSDTARVVPNVLRYKNLEAAPASHLPHTVLYSVQVRLQ